MYSEALLHNGVVQVVYRDVKNVKEGAESSLIFYVVYILPLLDRKSVV